MSLMSDPRYIQTTARVGYYPRFFGEFLAQADSVIDFGAGLNDYWITAGQNGKKFTRVDYKYADNPPRGDDYIAADFRKQIPGIQSGTYNVSLTSFVLQHVSDDEKIEILNEMNRVTAVSNGSEDMSGKIMVFPIFKPGRLRKISSSIGRVGIHRNAAAENQDVTIGYVVPPSESDDFEEKRFQYETLIIHKNKDNIRQIPAIIKQIVECGSLDSSSISKLSMSVGKIAARFGISPYRST
jgi:ubiquinone/menaquinone biosynthesis C-methylase UbiE